MNTYIYSYIHIYIYVQRIGRLAGFVLGSFWYVHVRVYAYVWAQGTNGETNWAPTHSPPNSSCPILVGLISIHIYYSIQLRRALFIGYIGWLHPLPQAPPVTAGTGRAGLVELEGIGEGLDW